MEVMWDNLQISSPKIDFFIYPNILFDQVIAKTLFFPMKVASINKSMNQGEFLPLEFRSYLVYEITQDTDNFEKFAENSHFPRMQFW